MATMLVVAFSVGSGWFIHSRLETWVDQFARSKLNSIQKKLSLKIEVGQISLRLGRVILSEVVLGEQAAVAIDRIDVAVEWRPWSPSFMRPSRLAIGRFIVKDRVEVQTLQSILERHFDQPKNGERTGMYHQRRDDVGLGMLLPQDIHLENAHMEVMLSSGNSLVISGGRFAIEVMQRRVFFEVDKFEEKGGLSLKNITGRLRAGDPKNIMVLVQSNPVNKMDADFKFDCHLGLREKSASCVVEAAKIPSELLTPLQRQLGTSFSPQILGHAKLSALNDKLMTVEFDGNVQRVVAENSSLSVSAVGPFDIRTKFTVDIDLGEKRIRSQQMLLDLRQKSGLDSPVVAAVKFDLQKSSIFGDRGYGGTLTVDLKRSPCQAVLESLPVGFAPDLSGVTMQGYLDATVNLSLSQASADLEWSKVQFDCSVVAAPAMYTASHLNGDFILERSFEDGRKVHIPVDETQPNFAKLSRLPKYVLNAIVSSEDAGFWQHHGIEPKAIEEALERNSREGRAAVGGSTITMQTVKNIFLSRDKTLSRKAQELFLAWHLENVISKKRILEIYLNVVEFGPELYGIENASKRFFGVSASDLSLKQSIYLASLLPAPIPRFAYYCKGRITPNYEQLLSTLLRRMHALGRITEEEYSIASDERLQFVPADGCKDSQSTH
jgi:hypothetical protein